MHEDKLSNMSFSCSAVEASYKAHYKGYTISNKLCSLKHVNMNMLTIGVGRGRGGGGNSPPPPPTLLTVYIMNFIAVLWTVLHVGTVPQGNHIFVV